MIDSVEPLFDLIDDLPVGIARNDTTGATPNHFNTVFLDMFGWRADEIDTMERWFQTAYPDEAYRARLIGLWDTMIEASKQFDVPFSHPIEVNVACKDGSLRSCEVRYYHKAHYVYGLFSDIEVRKALSDRLLALTMVDDLTGLHNRRYFNIQFYDRWHLSKRSQTPLSLIFCDIDGLKDIDHRYGSLASDEVLKKTAKSLTSTLRRTTDFIVRYSEEWFAIVSYDSDETSAYGACQMIQRDLAKVLHQGIEETMHGRTMSFGVASMIADDLVTPEQFISHAEEALDEAKRRGKDCIVVHPVS